MSITTVERLATIWKSLKSKPHDKFARIVILGGLGIMTTPLINILWYYIVGERIYLKIFGQNDLYIGLATVVVGLIYHLISQKINTPGKPKNSIKHLANNDLC